MARGRHFEHLTSCNVNVLQLLLHCVVVPYIFVLYMMFNSNAGDDNDDVITDVSYVT